VCMTCAGRSVRAKFVRGKVCGVGIHFFTRYDTTSLGFCFVGVLCYDCCINKS
jgi:hypothetical protein